MFLQLSVSSAGTRAKWYPGFCLLFHNVFLHLMTVPSTQQVFSKYLLGWRNQHRSLRKLPVTEAKAQSVAPWEIYSLVEEGKEVSHDNQSGFGQDQEDLPDVQSSLLQVVHC